MTTAGWAGREGRLGGTARHPPAPAPRVPDLARPWTPNGQPRSLLGTGRTGTDEVSTSQPEAEKTPRDNPLSARSLRIKIKAADTQQGSLVLRAELPTAANEPAK